MVLIETLLGKPDIKRTMSKINDTTKVSKERAILVGVMLNSIEKHNLDEHLDELEMLANTGAIVVGRVVQRIIKINPSTFIGTGKANQLIKQAMN